MRIIIAIGRLISGLLAVFSGIVTLLFNSVSYSIFKSLTNAQKYVAVSLIIVVGIFLILTSMIDFISCLKNNSRKHKLKYDSKKYISFFFKWYRRPGCLTIICDNLDWIKRENDIRIYNELINKSRDGKLTLFLGEGIDSKEANELSETGANLYSAPHDLLEHYSFSCLSVMGNNASRIIVRNKQNDINGSVLIEEICDTYISGLLNILINEGRRPD